MKNILKAFMIILVVVLSIGGTCFIFFKNYKRAEAESASLATCINMMDKINLEIVNYDGRFAEIEKTNTNLEDSLFALSSYFIDDEFIIQDDDIIDKIKNVTRSINLAVQMVEEYKIKSEFKNSDDKSYYDKDLGRNDLYNTMCDYIVEYATLISMVNSDLEYKNINKKADLKFEMIDLYCRVAVNTFSVKDANPETGMVALANTANIHLLNSKYNITTSYLTSEDKLLNTSYNNKFINYYSNCNKDDFAKNLTKNVEEVTSVSAESTDVEYATFYFKKIYGI